MKKIKLCLIISICAFSSLFAQKKDVALPSALFSRIQHEAEEEFFYNLYEKLALIDKDIKFRYNYQYIHNQVYLYKYSIYMYYSLFKLLK